jgi:PAS domain S-box-containing protein
MLEDIDDYKRTLAELSESEELFRKIFENAAVGIGLVGLDRVLFAANDALVNMSGYTREEFLGMSGEDLIHPNDNVIGWDDFQAMLEGRRDTIMVERRYVRKEGVPFWVRQNISMVRHASGEPHYLVVLVEDIDEQRSTRERLKAQEEQHLRTLEQRVEERTRALAATNRRLIKEMEQRFQAEEALAHKAAEDAVNAERTRLARDLHDAVTQTLFSASLIADVLPDLWEIDPAEAQATTEELRQLARGALAEMRTLLLELRPDAITQASLVDLLKQLSQALIGRAQLPVHLDVHAERSLPPDVQVAFYRIAQESLNNIVKYARAGRVDILLALEPERALMQICDDGIGFDKRAIKPSSLGMRIMRERAQGIGADFEISSRIGEGSTVSISWKDPKANGEHTPRNEDE